MASSGAVRSGLTQAVDALQRLAALIDDERDLIESLDWQGREYFRQQQRGADQQVALPLLVS